MTINLAPLTEALASVKAGYRANDKAIFIDANGQKRIATILRVCDDSTHAILKIEGWLGTHWTPLSKLS